MSHLIHLQLSYHDLNLKMPSVKHNTGRQQSCCPADGSGSACQAARKDEKEERNQEE